MALRFVAPMEIAILEHGQGILASVETPWINACEEDGYMLAHCIETSWHDGRGSVLAKRMAISACEKRGAGPKASWCKTKLRHAALPSHVVPTSERTSYALLGQAVNARCMAKLLALDIQLIRNAARGFNSNLSDHCLKTNNHVIVKIF